MLLEELIVKLALNSQDVEAKAGSATKKLGDIEKAGKGAEEGVQGIGKASKDTSFELAGLTGKLGVFLALVGGTVAIKTFIRDAIDANTQLSFLSRNLGVDAQSIFAWSTASQELGGTAAGLQGTLKMLSQEGSNLATLGESRLIPFFSRMRIALPNPQDPNGPTTALRQMAEYAERAMKLGASPTTMHNWFAEFIPDEGTINLILQGTAALDAAQARAKKWAPTNSELRNAVTMKTALADLAAQFTKVGYDVLQTITPALEKFFGWLVKVGDWIQQNSGLAAILAEAAVATAALGAIIAAVTSPVLLVAAAFTAVAAGILLMYNDYKTWKSGGMSEFNWSALAENIRGVGDAFDYVANMIEKATDKFAKWVESQSQKHPDVTSFLKGLFGTLSEFGPSGLLGDVKLTEDMIPMAAKAIQMQEGFDKPGSVPNRANNPGAIEYGPFTRRHGATGSIPAADGKQIAVFPDVDTGRNAQYELLRHNYMGMPLNDLIPKYIGHENPDLQSYLSGIVQSMNTVQSRNSAAVSSPGRLQAGLSAGEKKEVRIAIAQMHIHTQATDGEGIAKSIKRGTDFLTWGAPANGGSE